MRTSRRDSKIRAGFTLVEVLIVLVIIGVLAALLFPAMQGALLKGDLVQEVNEITQMGLALEEFKSKYGVYPPSRIRLREFSAYDLRDPFDAHSVRYLKRIWPQIALTTWTSPVGGGGTAPVPQTAFLWCKDVPAKTIATVVSATPGSVGAPTGSRIYELEGDECLVFFLGGIQEFNRADPTSARILHGFSTRPGNPAGVPDAADSSTLDREGPFFEFDNERLMLREGAQEVFDYTPLGPTNEEFDWPAGVGPSYLAAAEAQGSKLLSYRAILSEDSPIAYFSSYEGAGYRPHDMNVALAGPANEPTATAVPLSEPISAWAFQARHLGAVDRGNSRQEPNAFRSTPPNPYTETEPDPVFPSDPDVTDPGTGATDPIPVVRFLNPQAYQIISPGKDGLYGPGGKLPRPRTYEHDTDQPDPAPATTPVVIADLTPTAASGNAANPGSSFDNVSNVSGSSFLGDFNESQLEQ